MTQEPNNYAPIVTLDQLTPIPVVLTYASCFVVSTAILVIALAKAAQKPSPFHLALLGSSLPLTIGDVSYFFTLLGLLTPNSNEPVRALSPVLCGWLMCCLACSRFKIFYRAGLSPHYTDRVSRTLTGFIAVQGAGSIAFLVNTYIEQAWQPAFTTHPLRKLFMMQELGTCVIVDMCLNVATFRAVWGLRSAVLKRKAAQGNQQQRSGRSTTSRSSARNSGHGGNYTGSGLDSVPDMVFATSTTAAPAIRLGKMISFSDGVPDGPHLPHNSSTSGGGVASSKSDHNLIPRQPSSMSLKSLSASIAQLPTVVAARETIRRNLGERSVVRSEILFHCAIVLFCVVCMVISALMGAAVFILSTSMLGDAIGLLGTRLYVLGTIIQWLYIIRILE